jgi:hypothetical protein
MGIVMAAHHGFSDHGHGNGVNFLAMGDRPQLRRKYDGAATKA